MDIIYVDSLFVLNLLVNYFILLATARLCPHEPRRLRLAAGAALGGLYAVATVLPGLSLLRTAAAKLGCGIAMSALAFGGQGRLPRSTLVFFGVSAAFCGGVWALSMLAGGGLSPNRPYIAVSLPLLLSAFALCYALITLVFRRIGKRPERKIVELRIFLDGRSVALPALLDTGNDLCDPVSGAPVVAAEKARLSPLLPGDALCREDPQDLFDALAAYPELRSRLRLLPYSALGLESGLLTAIRPDRILVDGKPSAARLVALSPNPLSSDGEYQALV